jgi:hypothetical protein
MRLIPAAAIAAAMLALPVTAQADAAPPARSCSGYVYSATEPTGIKVARGSATCSTAKRVFKAHFGSNADCEESSCVRRHFGWTCQTAAAHAYPRVATCTKRRTVIEAWAVVD